MIILYVKTGCPYCARAMEALDEHNVVYQKKNILDPSVATELEQLGGKRQVPFMVDDNDTPNATADDMSMYESEDIADYIDRKFGDGTADPKNKIRLHISHEGGECEVCQ